LGLRAELESAAEEHVCALALIDEGLALAQQSGEQYTDAHLHRLRGDILLKHDPANPALAEEAFLAAVAVAKQQGSRSFGLRAALSLAKLYQSTNRHIKPTLSSRQRSKAFRRRRKCPKSPRRRQSFGNWRAATARLLGRSDQRGPKRQDASRTTSYPRR
jgi:hypothetical protein